MHFDQENGLKPHFGPFLALNGPFWANTFFFQKSKNVTFLDLIKANLMQKNQKKLMAVSMRTFVIDRLTDRLTDRRCWVHKDTLSERVLIT